MTYGEFQDEGRAFVINTPFTPKPWINKLFNDEFHIDITQRLQGGGVLMTPQFDTAAFNRAENRFYLNYNGHAYELCKAQGLSFSCEHRLYQTEVTELFDGLEVNLRVFVPVKGQRVFWTASLKNTGDLVAEVSLFSLFPFINTGYMAFEARYDEAHNFLYHTGFPYYVNYEDKEKKEEGVRFRYILSDVKVVSYDCNSYRFFGCDDFSVMPEAVKSNRCANAPCELEDCVSATQHTFVIQPGESRRVNILAGIEKTREAVADIAGNFPSFEEELGAVKALWDNRCDCFMIDTPDKELNYLTNHWLKRQLTFFARLNRGGFYCPVRNQLQDYLGYALIDPNDAFARAVKIVERQRHDGYLKQYYNTNGAPEKNLCLMRHSDAYVWLIICLIEIIEKTGDASLYQCPVAYSDSAVKEPVIIHLKKAAYYMSTQTGEHGLCLMLDGDWNDPVNGPGHKGKGESTWNSMALCYAIEKLNKIDFDATLEQFRIKLIQAVNAHCWDGNWYAAGISDDGVLYGSHKNREAKKFLNTQTWAIISGIAAGERLQKVKETIESLGNPFGYVLIDPPFSDYSPVWGRVSLKSRGTTENGSVYCHAVMFKALADCVRGDGDMARETILRVLPTNPAHPPEESLQIPIFYSNYYFGYPSENYGRSSCHYRTGTVAWHIWLIVEYMLGMRASSNGNLSVRPHLPQAWRGASVTRRFRGKTYMLKFTDGTPRLEVTTDI